MKIKMVRLIMALIGVLFVYGCCDIPCASLPYKEPHYLQKSEPEHPGFMVLETGMSKSQVHAVMGKPVSDQTYAWGSVWLYASDTGANQAGTSKLTPVVLDERGSLIGWGDDFLAMHRSDRVINP